MNPTTAKTASRTKTNRRAYQKRRRVRSSGDQRTFDRARPRPLTPRGLGRLNDSRVRFVRRGAIGKDLVPDGNCLALRSSRLTGSALCANSRFPLPNTIGKTIRRSSSTKPFASKAWTSWLLPATRTSPPRPSLTLVVSTGSSPETTVVLSTQHAQACSTRRTSPCYSSCRRTRSRRYDPATPAQTPRRLPDPAATRRGPSPRRACTASRLDLETSTTSPHARKDRSEERRVGKECRSQW